MIVGVLGGGQLGQMLALAGIPLGLRFRFFEPAEESCVDGIGERVRASYDDLDALARFADGLDVVTYEFENVPVEAVEFLGTLVPRVYPPVGALAVAQDRLREKEFFRSVDIPTARSRAASTEEEFEEALKYVGVPAVAKTRRMGYDGKGQVRVLGMRERALAWRELGGAPAIVERLIPFRGEFSVIAVRGRDGETAFYPATTNAHHDGILRRSIAPSWLLPEEAADEARSSMARAIEALDYVGVLTIEFFDTDHGVLANEMAPRVHNSGHWTIEGAATSQFENHLRAILGMPLGSTETLGNLAMFNLIGRLPVLDAAYALPDTHVHLYGKTPRAGRKLGHVTTRGRDRDELIRRMTALEEAGFGEE